LTMLSATYPTLRPIADTGVLVEFGDTIDDATHQQVLNFDAIISHANIQGVTESVPSYTSVLVGYNPLLTDSDLISEQIEQHLTQELQHAVEPTHWQIPSCYDESLAPDIVEVADQLGISTNEVIQQHCKGQYKIFMYGFAPGYAYMGGVPKSIQLPRKQAPVMNVPAQTLMIAGPQCLITTLTMPTGWWRIGMTSFKPLQMDKPNPFILGIGDTLKFTAMNKQDFKKFGVEQGH